MKVLFGGKNLWNWMWSAGIGFLIFVSLGFVGKIVEWRELIVDSFFGTAIALMVATVVLFCVAISQDNKT